MMKKKIFTYLLTAMVLTTTATVTSAPMKAYAYTQDELSAFFKYSQSLINQGYSKNEIEKYLNENTDGSITSAMQILPEAVASGALKKSGVSAPAAEEPAKAETAEPKKEEKPAHEHSYTANLTTNPTCTEEGVMTYTCECGDSYTESYPKLEHQYEKEVTKEATCAEEGVMTYTCSLCGDSYTESIPKAGHTPGAAQVTREAACTEDGEQTISCMVCGEVISTEAIPAKGHTAGEPEVTKAAGWFHSGLQETKCVDCGEVLDSEELPQTMGVVAMVVIVVVMAAIIGAVVYAVCRKKKK